MKLPLFIGKTFDREGDAVSETFLLPKYLVSKQKIPKNPRSELLDIWFSALDNPRRVDSAVRQVLT